MKAAPRRGHALLVAVVLGIGGLLGLSPGAPAATVKTLHVVSVDAVDSDGHYAAGAIDGDPSTRWESCGNGASLTLDLGRTETVRGVRIEFYRGRLRSYRFAIRVASDSARSKWTEVFDGHSALKKGYQSFKLPRSQAARFVQIVGYGNSSKSNGCLNSYTDVQLRGSSDYAGDMETGDRSQFTDLECKDPRRQFRVVTSRVRQGHYAGRFEESSGEVWSGNGTVRCMAVNANTDEQSGDDYYYSMSFYFPRPITNNLLWETHTRKDNIDLDSDPASVVPNAILAYGSPATYDQAADRLSYRLAAGAATRSASGWTGWSYTRPDLVFMRPIPLRTWIDVIVHIRFTESDQGVVQVWARKASRPWPRNPQVDLHDVPTLQYIPGGLDPAVPNTVHTTSLYDAIGLYKGGARTVRRDVVYIDAYRLTGSLNAARDAFGSHAVS